MAIAFHMGLHGTTGRRLLLAVCIGLVSCQEPEVEQPCGESLTQALEGAGLLDFPAEALATPLTYADDTVPGREGMVIDALPLSRGEHIVERWWRDPDACTLEGGAYGWAPPPPRQVSAPQGQTNLLTSFANPRVHALLITGPDAGSRTDYDAWKGALESMGAVGLTLFEPTRGEAEDALSTVCSQLTTDHSFVLITTGRAAPTQGGALHLEGEAWSYERVALLLGYFCSSARSRHWVLDAAWAQGLSKWPLTALPTRIWHASEPHHPNAPRLSPHGGGLLTAALTDHVKERAQALCLGGRGGEPEEIAWVFDDPAEVMARMKALRWEALGPTRLEEQEAGLATRPAVRHQLVDSLLDDLPTTIVSDFGSPESGYPCDDDDPCKDLISGCPMEPCETWHCVAGRCQPAAAKGRACDDGSVCTLDDTCDANGLCAGTWVPCADGDPCTTDTCHWDTGCVYVDKEAGDSCNDGDACTKKDVCDDLGVCAGEERDCEDGDPCTSDSCDVDEGCVHVHATAPCDDLNPCTHQDFCHSGVCMGQPLPCYDQNPCTLDTCDPKSGCAYLPTANGASCDDGDPCTQEERCEGGLCVGEEPDCDDGLECTLDYCEGGACVHLPPPGHCATAGGCTPVGEHPPDAPCLLCTATDVLEPDPSQDGVQCPDDGLPCTVDVCDAGECAHPPAPDTCLTASGGCVAVGEEVAPCLVCAATGIAVASSEGASCEDTNPCTTDEVCTSEGLCIGTPEPCCPGEELLTCGSVVVGNTAPPGGMSLVNVWPCYANFTMGGTETVFQYTAACTGKVSFHYDGPAGSLLFLLEDQVDGLTAQEACLVGECLTYSPSGASADLLQGESVLLVIDSWSDEGAQGTFELETTCDCSP